LGIDDDFGIFQRSQEVRESLESCGDLIKYFDFELHEMKIITVLPQR
jgi:hypothetical protein